MQPDCSGRAFKWFHHDSSVTHDVKDSDGGISFLVLLIKHAPSEDRIAYSMFRKPTKLYCYLPWKSACPGSIKHAVIDSELAIIHRTCMSDAYIV